MAARPTKTYEAIRKLCKGYAQNGTQMTVGDFVLVGKKLGLTSQYGQPINTARGMGSTISAAWRYTNKNFGPAEADNIAVTFIDPRTGRLVWKKYHD